MEDIRLLMNGEWVRHQDHLMNGYQKISITNDNIISVTESHNITTIKGLSINQSLELELIAITEKCMVLREELVIYVLLRKV